MADGYKDSFLITPIPKSGPLEEVQVTNKNKNGVAQEYSYEWRRPDGRPYQPPNSGTARGRMTVYSPPEPGAILVISNDKETRRIKFP